MAAPTKQNLFILAGATATGKTALSLKLAKTFDFEILNADSLQMYRHMDIGTGKPTADERAHVPHHLFDVHDPIRRVSALEYAQEASVCLKDLFQQKKKPLLVGGSGFYMRALVSPAVVPEGRALVTDYAGAYQTMLTKDPDLEQWIHCSDHYRIERAMFLLEQGIVPSRAWAKAKDKDALYKVHYLILGMERERHKQLLEERTETMFDAGWIEETKGILKAYPDSKAVLNPAIGYRSIVSMLEGRCSQYEMKDEITIDTRRYAKRQNTWFRNQCDGHWSEPKDAYDAFSCYLEKAL